MKLDEHSFEQTARAVYLMNPYAREKYDNWLELEEFMRWMAYQYSHESNSFGTGGFQLTAFNQQDGERCVHASVQAYTALKYAEQFETENA
jgi:hypothetical protein